MNDCFFVLKYNPPQSQLITMNDMKNHASAGKTADKHVHKFTTRNTDTITNTHVRKLTSIALMAIMVGGGLTFAIPGMEPVHAVMIQSEPHLAVSAEGQNADNEIGKTNIVEVIVDDDRIGDIGDAAPLVTVGDEDLTMYQAGSGAWYGYFASEDIRGIGLTIGACLTNPTCTDVFGEALIIKGAPDKDADGIGVQTLHVFALDSSFDVTYDRPGTDETVSMEYDDPDSGVSLDRTTYPQNTGVVITIDDQALNVDPTSTDVWTFVSNGDQFYGTPTTTTVGALETAVDDRDGKISIAQSRYDNTIGDNPEPDPAEARTTLQAKSNAADEIINNPLNDPAVLNGETTPTLMRLTELIRDYGQGTKTVTPNTVVDENTAIGDIPDNFRGNLWIEYEDDYGRGDRTSDDADDPNYKGQLLMNYQTAYGQGDRNDNDPDSEHYKGTALIEFERVDGNGDRSNTDLTNAQDNPNYDGINMDETLDGILDESVVKIPKNYRGSAWIEFDTQAGTAVTDLDGTDVTDGLESFDIDANNILACASDDCTAAGNVVVRFTEDGSNNSIFNNAPDGTSNIQTESNAQRGLSFSVSYGSDSASSGIGYSTTNIVIDAGSEWNSGQEVGITLTDSDANTNSLDADDLDVSNPDHIIPTITIGEPLTLTNGIEITTLEATPADTATAPDPPANNGLTVTQSDARDGDVSQRKVITATIGSAATTDDDGNLTVESMITIGIEYSDVDAEYKVVNYDLGAFEGATLTIDGVESDLSSTYVTEELPTEFVLTYAGQYRDFRGKRNSNRHPLVRP